MKNPNSSSFFFWFAALCMHESGRVLIFCWVSLSEAQNLNLLLPSFSRTEKGSSTGGGVVLEGTGRERERLVADGGKGKGRGGGDRYLIREEEDGRRRKGSGKGEQRLVNGRFKTGPPEQSTTKELAAPSLC